MRFPVWTVSNMYRPAMNEVNQGNFAAYSPNGYGLGYPNESSVSSGLPIRIEGGGALPDLMAMNSTTSTLRTFHCPNCLATILPGHILVNIGTTSCGSGHSSGNLDMQGPSEWPSFSTPSGLHHPDSTNDNFLKPKETEPTGPYSASPGDFSSWPMSDYVHQATGTSPPHAETLFPVTSVTPLRKEGSAVPLSDSDGTDLDDQASAETTPAEDNSENGRKRAPTGHKETPHKYVPAALPTRFDICLYLYSTRRRKSTNYKIIFACTLGDCAQTFTLQKDLNRHQRQSLMHKAEWENKFFCEESRCRSFGKSYTRKDNFNRHVETKHGKFAT